MLIEKVTSVLLFWLLLIVQDEFWLVLPAELLQLSDILKTSGVSSSLQVIAQHLH